MTQDLVFSKVETWRIKIHKAVPTALHGLVPLPRDKEMDAGHAARLLSQLIHPPTELLLPLLKPALESSDAFQQAMALTTLARASGDRKLALPHVVKALENPDQELLLLLDLFDDLSDFNWEELDGVDVTTAASNLIALANSSS